MKYITLTTKCTEEIFLDDDTGYCALSMSKIFQFHALENDVNNSSAIAELALTSGQIMSYLKEKVFIPLELTIKTKF